MRVLVVGGCGFIGSHLVDSLCGCGFEVEVWDDQSTCWLDEVGNISRPRWLHPNARFVGDGLKDNLPVTASVAVWCATKYPLDRDLIDVGKATSDAAKFASRCFDAVAARSALERVVIAASRLDCLSDARPAFAVDTIFHGILGYLHRPPGFQLRRVQLPEVFGPRQLPGVGVVSKVCETGILPPDSPSMFEALPIDEAVKIVGHHILAPANTNSIFEVDGKRVHFDGSAIVADDPTDRELAMALRDTWRFYGGE